VWGSKGSLSIDRNANAIDGVLQFPINPAERHHLTAKPVALMQEIVQVCEKGGTIADPFAGSGTTGVAALLEGYQFIGCEREAAYVKIARQRLHEVENPLAGLEAKQGVLVV